MKPTDQEWMRTDWDLRARRAGIHHVSFVVPGTVFGQISVQSYTHNAAENSDYEIETSQYRTLKDAKQCGWRRRLGSSDRTKPNVILSVAEASRVWWQSKSLND